MKKSFILRLVSIMMTAVMAASLCSVGAVGAAAEQTPAQKYAAHREINLWGDVIPYNNMGANTTTVPTIVPYIAANNPDGLCAVIIPGGGYSGLSMEKDGIQIAQYLNSVGISAFIVKYRVTGSGRAYDYRAILSDGLRGVRFVRYNAEEFGINPDKLFTIGFSAGGHLASMTATHYDFQVSDSRYTPDAIDAMSAKPNATVLSYPATSICESYAHAGTRTNFARGDQLIEKMFSGERSVDENTPPIFIWHTWQDTKVSVLNSISFVDALREAGVPCEMHIYGEGDHGLGIATKGKTAYSWPEYMTAWIHRTLDVEVE